MGDFELENAPQSIKQSTVLHRLSVHLDLLAARIFEVEEELGKVLSSNSTDKEVSITKLQSLDFTRQSLEDCALLLQMIKSSRAADDVRIPQKALAASDLKLNSTKSIIQSGYTHGSTDVSGQVDFF